jgi:hypothetical protein
MRPGTPLEELTQPILIEQALFTCNDCVGGLQDVLLSDCAEPGPATEKTRSTGGLI